MLEINTRPVPIGLKQSSPTANQHKRKKERKEGRRRSRYRCRLLQETNEKEEEKEEEEPITFGGNRKGNGI
jgi:hypothetical protein